MTIKSGFIKALLLGAVCTAGLAAASPSEARTYYSVGISSGDPYYHDSYYYDRYPRYSVAYERPYYRHHHRYGYAVAYDDPYYRSRYRCYREWDGDRVCYRRW